MNRTDRLYAIVEELRAVAPSTRSAPWMAERFEVSVRTIERDLSALQQAGVPVYATPGRRGGYAIDAAHTLPPVNFTPAEATAIAAALGRDSTPFTQAGRSALRKVVAAMSQGDADSARALGARVRLFSRPESERSVPAAVERAIVERLVVRLVYVDRDGARSDRVIEPAAVVGVEPNWYVWGWCRLREEPRTFGLDRIEGATLTGEVAPDRGLDPASVSPPDMVRRPDLFE